MQDTPQADGLNPGTVACHHGVAESLRRARALKHEMLQSVLATDTHQVCSGVWRRPCKGCGRMQMHTSTVEVGTSEPPGPHGMGLVWIACRAAFEEAQAQGATAGELYGLGRVCCVQSVGMTLGNIIVGTAA